MAQVIYLQRPHLHQSVTGGAGFLGLSGGVGGLSGVGWLCDIEVWVPLKGLALSTRNF